MSEQTNSGLSFSAKPEFNTVNQSQNSVDKKTEGITFPDRPVKSSSKIIELLKILLAAVALAYIIKTFIIQPFKIPTGSMEETLFAGDMIIANKCIYGAQSPATVPFTDIKIPLFRFPAFRQPVPGDVIIFKFPNDPTIDYIKRCVAIAGQTIEIKNKRVYVDGNYFTLDSINPNIKHEDPDIIEYDKGYESVYPPGAGSRDNYGPVTVPDGSVFVLGDNRDRSYDSRKWGFVPLDHIIGKAMIIYWSTMPDDDFHIRWYRVGKLVE